MVKGREAPPSLDPNDPLVNEVIQYLSNWGFHKPEILTVDLLYLLVREGDEKAEEYLLQIYENAAEENHPNTPK